MQDSRNPYKNSLETAFRLANEFLDSLDSDPVGVTASYEQLRSAWNQALPEHGEAPEKVLEELHASARPGLMLSQSGRFYAWVIGGTHPAALGADWLTSVWDQNSGLFAVAPSGAIVEEIAGEWLKKLLKLPTTSSFAFVTGCQMAHFTCMLAARNHLFRLTGWDVEADGIFGAPGIRVVCSDQKHATVNRALRMLGFGINCITDVPSDDQGRIDLIQLEDVLARESNTPTLLLLQAGDVNTGGFDDFKTIIPLARRYPCWVHVDGAFGLWAAASKTYAHLTEGADQADSWATDGHKWLNVPYDSGYAFVAHPEPHARALSQMATYLTHDQQARDQMNWNPEFSRRARGFATWAAIRELGSEGIEELINRTCQHAKEIVHGAGQLEGVEIVSAPVINQGLLRFHPRAKNSEVSEADHFTEKVIQNVNTSGEAFFQPTTYKGRRCMRVSVSGWRTGEIDVRRTIEAIRNAVDEARRSQTAS